jgi:2',3'-cyclic-nucleotide 2'-phosphodiesterase/3'-nucleotidase
MKKTAFLFALICISTTAMAQSVKTVTLRLIETSDVHGAFFPYDFTERRPMEGTMARVSSYLN